MVTWGSVEVGLHLVPGENERGVAVDVIGRVAGLAEVLYEVDGEVGEVGQVEAVEPNHGPAAILAVVVPVPRGGQYDITTLHLDTTALDSGEATVPLDDEAHGKGSVAVGLGRLVWHDQLQAGVYGVGGEWGLWKEQPGLAWLNISLKHLSYILRTTVMIVGTSLWVGEHQNAALGLALCDKAASLDQAGADLVVAPHMRYTPGVWHRRVQP